MLVRLELDAEPLPLLLDELLPLVLARREWWALALNGSDAVLSGRSPCCGKK